MLAPRGWDDLFIKGWDATALKQLLGGSRRFPSASKRGLLFSGPYGTGKTVASLMIASLMEYEKSELVFKDDLSWGYRYQGEFIHCCGDPKGEQTEPFQVEFTSCGEIHGNAVASHLDALTRRASSYGAGLFHGSDKSHFILDELDCWGISAQEKLKGWMTNSPPWVVFYLTTNHPQKIDGGVMDRCYQFKMEGGSPQKRQQMLISEFPFLARLDQERLLSEVTKRPSWRALEDLAVEIELKLEEA